MRTFAILLLCGLCLSAQVVGQSFSHCDVYQFEGTDSSKKRITLQQSFNSNGHVISETYSGYKRSAVSGRADGSYFYFYNDTLLIKRSYVDERGDSTKMLCYYNNKNQLIRQEHFDYERRLKKNHGRGNGQPGGCIIRPSDYEKKRTWKKISEVNYSYDTNDNRILYDATKLHFTMQDKYTWTYDSLGRVTKYSSYDDTRLFWIEEYSYFPNGFSFTRTWYDYDGNPEHLSKESWSYMPQYTSTFTLNSQGRVIRKVVTTEKGETSSTEIYSYNSSGQLIRSVHLDGAGNPEITHIYVYK